MKVYSPSATDTWERCPYLRQAEQAGWHEQLYNYGDLAMLAGTAFAKGMEMMNLDRKSQAPLRLPAYQDAAKDSIYTEMQRIAAGGGVWDARALDSYDAYQDGVREALVFMAEKDPTMPEWKVSEVEVDLGPEAGWSRPDVIYAHQVCASETVCKLIYIIRDYKFKLVLDKKWETERLNEYRASTQAKQYLYFVPEARYFQPLIVVAKPKPHVVGLDVFLERDQPALDRWATSQRAKWLVQEMQEKGELPLWESKTHEDKFGPCMMKEACLTYNRDAELMRAEGYVQIKKVWNR